MNSSIFIAKRLFTAKENNNNYTRPIIRIAILAIAISVAVMILSVFILSGFKDNISNKVIGFGSHIKITKFNNNQSFENDPIEFNFEIYEQIKNLDHLIAFEIRKSRASYRFDGISPCLTTKMGTGGNNVPYLVNYERFFTIRELLRIQGFPDAFNITDSYSNALMQIGNSVSVPVIKNLIDKITEYVE